MSYPYLVRLRPVVIVSLLLVAPATSWGYLKRYLPLDERELSLRFPQRVLRSNFVQPMSAHVGCTPISWYSSMFVVIDSAHGRQAATLGSSQRASTLLDTILQTKLTVQVRGKRRYAVTRDHSSSPPTCVPESVWASETTSIR